MLNRDKIWTKKSLKLRLRNDVKKKSTISIFFTSDFFYIGLLHNIGPCFDIAFAQLEVIPKTRNKFAEIVAVAERYLIITNIKKQRIKEAAVPNMPFCNNMR